MATTKPKTQRQYIADLAARLMAEKKRRREAERGRDLLRRILLRLVDGTGR